MVKYKFILIAVFCIIVILAGALIIKNKIHEDNNQISMSTDKQPIIDSFPQIGEFKSCYWMTGYRGAEASQRLPGPNDYWIKGFIEIDGDIAYTFIEEYNMQEMDEVLVLDFLPDNTNFTDTKWYYSDEFNNFIKPVEYGGELYINRINNYIYFEIFTY